MLKSCHLEHPYTKGKRGDGSQPGSGIFGAEGAAMWGGRSATSRRLQSFHPYDGLESARHGGHPKLGGVRMLDVIEIGKQTHKALDGKW